MTQVVVRPPAAADLDAAYRWYEAQRPGLGDEFLDVVQSAFELLEARPLAFPVVHRDQRRLVLKRFPYSLIYRVLSDEVVVTACPHGKQHPRRWRSRR